MLDSGYRVVPAAPSHLGSLAGVELAAAGRFAGWDVPAAVLTEATDEATLLAARVSGLLWVALDPDGAVIGFALCREEGGALVLEEVDVVPARGRRGVGAALVEAAIEQARASGHSQLYLSTYRDVPWNAPWYERLGFERAPEDDPVAAALLARDDERGLATMPRVALRADTAADGTGPTERRPLTSNPLRTAVDLYWIPLGAGGHLVRLNGKAFEAVVATLERRRPLDLYHTALVVQLPEGRYTIESAPVPDADGHTRGIVGGGPVGSRWAGRWRIFRYEIRVWRDGIIPDLGDAVASPQRLTEDEASARRVLALAPHLPTPVWGRDELRAGEMWNSNSIISWLIVRSGLDLRSVSMPRGGRAPGWDAGLAVARRHV